ncbi:uncharacterized protein LOC131629638 [Vicia villosa]|uniref:uncharacterized protein LOC131629638 n=1 Tax=Vicia villosa TaxID=3911 RepID=UPI00273BDE62|nr:uncharacterized protein LOC131629638 [Vicia villosa]
MTFNVRGCGNSIKKGRICQLLNKGKAVMCFLQETKVEVMTDDIVKSLWGSMAEVEWSAKGSDGRSGGILIMWRKNVITPVCSFMGNGYLGINASYRGKNCYFINVYSPCFCADKRKLWYDLLLLKSRWIKGEWIVRGDFNAVKFVVERRGRIDGGRRGVMEDFNSFINLIELVDVLVLGCIHTWINSSGSASSRLDRFLISDGIIQWWKIVAQCSGSRDISDHRPVLIKTSNLDWGPKPFKVFNTWFQHKDFICFVKSAWDSFHVRGKKFFVIREKFRLLKEKLFWWNKNVFGWVDLQIEE